jgi:methionine-rich copper-binding protein CopC
METTMKAMRQRLMAMAIGTVCAAALGVALHAHAKLVKTAPADGSTVATVPANVELTFNEPLDVKVSKVELVGPSGKVELGPLHAMSAKSLMAPVTGKLSDGAYTVNWQTAGDDGHVQKGKFGFTLKQAK